MKDDEYKLSNHHDKSIQYLIKAYQCNRIHHAFLFTGIEGVGRFNAAMHFAMICNCETRFKESQIAKPCGECKACRRIISNQHPDMIHIQPDGVSIKIDQVRSLRKKLTYKPVIASMRFVFLVKANAMTIESANALLKILEEPPSNTIFILIVENQRDVLQTISSRCQQIRFKPYSEKAVFDDLTNNAALENDLAWIIAKLSMGSVIRASLFQKKKWINKRTFILDRLSQLDRLSIGMRLCFAEQLSKNKEELPDILEMMLTWFRDVLIYRFCPERIINIDYKNEVYAHAIKYSDNVIINKIEQIQIVQKDLMANMNKRLAFEQLMLIHL